jgi:hypothetical protein
MLSSLGGVQVGGDVHGNINTSAVMIRESLREIDKWRFIMAVAEMSLTHGHDDMSGLAEAFQWSKSINAEPCWRCGKPRFQKGDEI